jgi:hypothetical protein
MLQDGREMSKGGHRKFFFFQSTKRQSAIFFLAPLNINPLIFQKGLSTIRQYKKNKKSANQITEF